MDHARDLSRGVAAQRSLRTLFGLLVICLLALPSAAQFGGGGGGGGRWPLPQGPPGNVILILADDIGQDVLAAYDLGGACSGSGARCRSGADCQSGETCEQDHATTPRLDQLAAGGVRFTNAWSNAVCSPTRATILTGRYGFRTGIGAITRKRSINNLAVNELIIPEVLELLPPPVAYDVKHAAIGKWHLTSFVTGSEDHPRESGFSHFAGAMYNLNGESFFNWTKHVNGQQLTSAVRTYATTDNVNDALAWIDQQTADPPPLGFQPFFLYWAPNAAHSPWEHPPADLLSSATRQRLAALGLSEAEACSTAEEKRACYLAAIEALDSEIGRLLDGIDPATMEHTTVIFVGDNGTPGNVTVDPFDSSRVKGSFYQGGINVPLIVWGGRTFNGGRVSDELVNTTDLFATAIELATGFALRDLLPAGHVHDSVSMVPVLEDVQTDLRQFAYAEGFAEFGPGFNHRRTIRGDRFKLIRFDDGTEEFYDLDDDPFEESPIDVASCSPVQCGAYDTLVAELGALEQQPARCPFEAACTDCPGCDVLDILGQEQCEPTNTLILDSCLRPNADGETFSTCNAAGGTIDYTRCFCEIISGNPETLCPGKDQTLSGLACD